MTKKDTPVSSITNNPDADPIEPPPSDDPRGGDDLISGVVDAVDAQGTVTGRITRAPREGVLQVSFYIDARYGAGSPVATVTPTMGTFSWSIPAQFRDGVRHQVAVYAFTTRARQELRGSPQYFTLYSTY